MDRPRLPVVDEACWRRLRAARFRAGFALDAEDASYLEHKGLSVMLAHAADFIARRLAPAHPVRDGRQTPWRGHPVFVAQHATASCCRGCVAKWHGFPAGQALTEQQQAYLLALIHRWLVEVAAAGGAAQADLFG
ncbi:DUF4186 domain-containing protein [Frateuria aurantia]